VLCEQVDEAGKLGFDRAEVALLRERDVEQGARVASGRGAVGNEISLWVASCYGACAEFHKLKTPIYTMISMRTPPLFGRARPIRAAWTPARWSASPTWAAWPALAEISKPPDVCGS
jgi:hypothetical protein